MIKEFKTKYMYSFSEFEFNNSIFNNLVSIFHIFLETIFVKNIAGQIKLKFSEVNSILDFWIYGAFLVIWKKSWNIILWFWERIYNESVKSSEHKST